MISKTYRQSLVTPLSSIFGSGFLIIAPILASTVGKYSVFIMALVCFVAYLIGGVIRYNIKNVEPQIENKTASKSLRTLESISDLLLIPAYIISVTLYLKILSSFVLEPFNADLPINENILVTMILIAILLLSIVKGLESLSFLETVSLLVTFIIIALLFIGYFNYDIAQLKIGITWPVPVEQSLFEKITIVAGTLIVVQGFETTRYLSYKFDAPTRIKACRDAQIISTIIYLSFITLTTPIMFNLNLQGPVTNNELIILTRAAFPLLVFPLIIAAMLSQFSAAIADTFAASGNIEEATTKKLSVKKGSLIVIVIAIILTWIVSSAEVVVLASKAFAIYYLFQVIVALKVTNSKKQKLLFSIIFLILLFVIIFAKPAG